MSKTSWIWTIQYRCQQVWWQLGFERPLTVADKVEVARWLPGSALPLFDSMSVADQQHSLRVCRGLQARGYHAQDLLAAALLHDVGKAEGRVPFWTRPVIVLGKILAPTLLQRVMVDPNVLATTQVPRWRKALSYAWWHAEVGAQLAAQAGLSDQAVLYIRTHHQPQGPAAALHLVDEVS